ncbi:hypothetical protein [Streptomyces hydrogenans]|uniref:hypothetical protein n=1 Tax=Streptomyces hydrogenans TaxID=1873719 RepID=UPI0035DE89E3
MTRCTTPGRTPSSGACGTSGSTAPTNSPRTDLADLVEFADSCPELAVALQPYHGRFEARLQAATSVGALDARRLRRNITRLASRRTTNDAG